MDNSTFKDMITYHKEKLKELNLESEKYRKVLSSMKSIYYFYFGINSEELYNLIWCNPSLLLFYL